MRLRLTSIQRTCTVPSCILTRYSPLKLRSKIVTETNAHFHAGLRNLPPEQMESKRRADVQLTSAIFSTLLAILILFGMRGIPSDRYAWSNRIPFEFPAVQRLMTRDAFHRVKNTLHFCDNSAAKPSEHPDHDPCHKSRLLLETARYFKQACILDMGHVYLTFAPNLTGNDSRHFSCLG